jgi:hypothetical protein
VLVLPQRPLYLGLNVPVSSEARAGPPLLSLTQLLPVEAPMEVGYVSVHVVPRELAKLRRTVA